MAVVINKIDKTITRGVLDVCQPCGDTWQRCKGVFIILVLVALLVIAYWIFLMLTYRTVRIVKYDFLNYEVMHTSFMRPLSFWPITHFVLFFILGFLFPSCYVLVLSLGVVWEIIEVIFSKVFRTPYQTVRAEATNYSLEYHDNYWAGSFRDIIMNFAGFGLGYAFRSWMDGIKDIQERSKSATR